MDQGPVMFIDGENSIRYIKRQIIQAYLSLGILDSGQLNGPYDVDGDSIKDISIPNIYVYDSSYGLNFHEKEGMQFIEEEIKRIKPVLVIWDSFYTFFTGDVKEEKDVLPILNNMTAWRIKYNTGVAVVVHFNKGNGPTTAAKAVDINRISGTKVFGNWYETAWLVSNPNASNDLEPEIPEDDEEDDLAGENTIVLRCLFRESRKRISTITMKMSATSCEVFVAKGVKQDIQAAKMQRVKFKIEEMPAEVIKYYNAHPDGYARSSSNLCIEICNQDKRFARDKLRLALEMMRQDGVFDVVKGKNGGEMLALNKAYKINTDIKSDDL
jgi:hypothetical protein